MMKASIYLPAKYSNVIPSSTRVYLEEVRETLEETSRASIICSNNLQAPIKKYLKGGSDRTTRASNLLTVYSIPSLLPITEWNDDARCVRRLTNRGRPSSAWRGRLRTCLHAPGPDSFFQRGPTTRNTAKDRTAH